MSINQYNFPTRILSGPGSRKRLPAALAEFGVARPLLVTDRGVVALPWYPSLETMLNEAGRPSSSFSEVWGNPVTSQVVAGVEAYKAHEADGIVTIGGGAAMDVAKAIALMVNHPGHLFDYEDGKEDGRPVDQAIPKIFALPTTAGTGSEVGRSAVISDDETHVKKIIFDPQLLPVVAFLDAELTLGLPASITASTGLDALSHLCEAYLAKGTHPMADGIALEGIRLVSKYLRKAVHYARTAATKATPENPFPEASALHLEARTAMLEASMMGAVAFQKGLGVTHSCAHSLSTVCDLHHGLVNGILMPYTMAYNGKAVPERLAAMAKAVDAKGHDTDGFVHWLQQLQDEVEIPRTLGEVGVKEEQIEALVKYALLDGCHHMNPCPVSEHDFRLLFEQAIHGKL